MAHLFNLSFPILFSCIISHGCVIQLVESYRAILEQAQSITGVTYLPSVNGNSNGNATAGGRPASASSHRGAGQGALTQEVMDGMLQNATYGMQMLDVALRTKTLQGPGPPASQHYPQHQPQHPSQPHHQPPLNSTSSLTAPSTQVQPTASTTSVAAAGSSSGSSYGYNTNSHPHPQQNSSSNSSSPRIMKDGGGGGGGVKGGADDGGRKVKSEGAGDKGVPANGTSAGGTPTTATAAVAAGATGAGAGSTAPTGGDRSKRQVCYCLFCLQ